MLRNRLLLLPLLLSACAVTPDAEPPTQEDDLKASGSPKWLYTGPMPTLEGVRITVSLKGHTARVTGLLPTTFSGTLPWYAQTELENGRTRVTVVYPVATGAVATSNGPGSYPQILGVPYVPTNDHAAWGGFPFLKYHLQRGLAFHGPITAKDGEWKLLRGPVSHGCNRMQGEHVVELAQIIGFDMHKPHLSSESASKKVAVDVIPGYDSWHGKLVDVDYPVQPNVQRPTGDVQLFATWNSTNLPRFVCAWNSKTWTGVPAKDAHHCDVAGTNKIDWQTGAKTP